MRFSVLSLFIATVTFGSAQTVSNGLLPAKHIRTLKRLQMRWHVPSYLPIGTRFKNFRIEDTKSRAQTWGQITYDNPKSRSSLTIQFASDGLGDIFFTDQNGETYEPTSGISFKAKFGAGRLEQVKNKYLDEVVMQWMELPGKGYPKFISAIGRNMSLGEMKKVVESLRPVK